MKLLSHYLEYRVSRHPEITNWKTHFVNDSLAYSFRDTAYDRRTYPSNLHCHDYYELVAFEEGDIQYICEGNVYRPAYGDVVLIPPGSFHMSVINCENTHYVRHVFYFYPAAFDAFGQGALLGFLHRTKGGDLLAFRSLETRRRFMELLGSLKETYARAESPLEDALGLSYIVQLFYLLNQEECQSGRSFVSLPENVLKLQRYIDENYAGITSVSQVAENFFYSREYVSRLFRKHFDTTIADYLMKRRVSESQKLLMQDLSVSEIAARVGFGSLSSYLRAFRSVTNMTPATYRRYARQQS